MREEYNNTTTYYITLVKCYYTQRLNNKHRASESIVLMQGKGKFERRIVFERSKRAAVEGGKRGESVKIFRVGIGGGIGGVCLGAIVNTATFSDSNHRDAMTRSPASWLTTIALPIVLILARKFFFVLFCFLHLNTNQQLITI